MASLLLIEAHHACIEPATHLPLPSLPSSTSVALNQLPTNSLDVDDGNDGIGPATHLLLSLLPTDVDGGNDDYREVMWMKRDPSTRNEKKRQIFADISV